MLKSDGFTLKMMEFVLRMMAFIYQMIGGWCDFLSIFC